MDKNQVKECIAKRVAKELKDGDVINLGIGLPTLVANYVPEGVNIFFQSAIHRRRPLPTRDPRIINAGGQPVTILPEVFFDSATSFGIIRGGHVNATVLGALRWMNRNLQLDGSRKNGA